MSTSPITIWSIQLIQFKYTVMTEFNVNLPSELLVMPFHQYGAEFLPMIVGKNMLLVFTQTLQYR